jgi:hypothetical protein
VTRSRGVEVTGRTTRNPDTPPPRCPDPLASPRERPSRNTFWIDDRVIDQYGPLLERFPFGADALAVYAVLARRADRDGESWERVKPMARLAATKERTFQRCIRLLELLELVAVESCYFEGTKVQTINRYTLLTPPREPPDIDPDPARWPPPVRPAVFVSKGANRSHVADARPRQSSNASQPWSAAIRQSPTGCRPDTTPGVASTLQEGETAEGLTRKERSPQREKDYASFTIDEVGLSNRQVWAATLGELARRGQVGRAELESWLRPAALIGRDGPTLIVDAPNAVTRDRITTRLLPAVRDALGATIGVPVGVSVVVAERG